jgi:hypothetical protein
MNEHQKNAAIGDKMGEEINRMINRQIIEKSVNQCNNVEVEYLDAHGRNVTNFKAQAVVLADSIVALVRRFNLVEGDILELSEEQHNAKSLEVSNLLITELKKLPCSTGTNVAFLVLNEVLHSLTHLIGEQVDIVKEQAYLEKVKLANEQAAAIAETKFTGAQGTA